MMMSPDVEEAPHQMQRGGQIKKILAEAELIVFVPRQAMPSIIRELACSSILRDNEPKS
jgi:hypothetical protein